MLSNVADNDVFKRTLYDKLVTDVNAIDAKTRSSSGLVTKIQRSSGKQGI